jgi:CxxC motif-containing protein (DUF1111 family)
MFAPTVRPFARAPKARSLGLDDASFASPMKTVATVAIVTIVSYAASAANMSRAPSVTSPAALAGLPPRLAEDVHEGAVLFERVWTQPQGLGPLINAQACVACHSHPSAGGTTTDPDNFVLFSPEVTDPSGGHAFARFEIFPNRSARPRVLPRLASRRRPPPLFGLGLLEAVSSQQPSADPGEPAGRARGRFGLKGRFHSIDEAVEAAFANEMGLTSTHTSPDGRGEIGADVVRSVSQFVRLLPPPAPPIPPSEGLGIFKAAGCAVCHSPTLRTGHSTIAALRDQIIAPYTDLALHDLGDTLSDGWDDGNVRGSDFRTPPLWGLRTNGPPYLHDGRAASLEMAIELHGGEAERARAAFRRLPVRQREQLVRFLKSL